MYDSVVKTVHGRSGAYCVKFTHADLNPSNIQYHNGRIMGIIDWEFAGWYPEYWEYTKMWFADRPVYKTFFTAIEGDPTIDKYPEELRAERDIWPRLSPWAYDAFYGQPGNIAAFNKSITGAKSEWTYTISVVCGNPAFGPTLGLMAKRSPKRWVKESCVITTASGRDLTVSAAYGEIRKQETPRP